MTLGVLFKSRGYTTAIAGKWHLGASEQSWPIRQGFDEYRVGVLETTDGTLYRDAMQRAGLPEAAVAAAEASIGKGDASGSLKKVRPYTVDYRRQVEGDIARASVEFIQRPARAKQPFFLLRSDPFETADHEGMDHKRWRIERAFLLVPAQQFIGQFLATFKEFPPSQKPGSFSLDRVLEALQSGAQGGGR